MQHIDKRSREIKIIGDGACPPSLAGKLGPAGFAEHGIPTEGEAGGLSIKLVCKAGRRRAGPAWAASMAGSPWSSRAARSSSRPADQLSARQLECGIPFWPHGFVTAHCNIDALLEHWTNEYACLGYGAHLYGDLIEFCKQTGIETILP